MEIKTKFNIGELVFSRINDLESFRVSEIIVEKGVPVKPGKTKDDNGILYADCNGRRLRESECMDKFEAIEYIKDKL